MAAICASPPADAQTPAQMGGTIQDPTGAPISEMTITLKGAAERVTLSGPDGRFAFENLPATECREPAGRKRPSRATSQVVAPWDSNP